MSLNIYSQYTKPEGSIKFTDLVLKAKKKGCRALGLTDHGNFSGIAEFYNSCVDHGIKPVIGIDLFCLLPNGKFIRTIIYLKNFNAYCSVLKLLPEKKVTGEGLHFVKPERILELKDVIICLNTYKTDILSSKTDIEKDINYLSKIFKISENNSKSIYFQIMFDDDEDNLSQSQAMITMSENNSLFAAIDPVYYIEEDDHTMKDFIVRISGGTPNPRQYRKQYLGNNLDRSEKIPREALVNTENIIRECHFKLENMPVKYPRFKIDTKIEYSYFETFKELVAKKARDLPDNIKKILRAELYYIKTFNIADIILFLIEAKQDFYEKYKREIFFSGFLSDIHTAYIFNLTLSSPLFSTSLYHKSVLSNNKLHPRINVIVSPESRNQLTEFLSERFSKETVCFLSEYVRWHFQTVLGIVEKGSSVNRTTVNTINKFYNLKYKYSENINDLMSIKEIKEEMNRYPDTIETVKNAFKADDVFKNYNTNTNQLVVSEERIDSILPITGKVEETSINTSFFNMNTAKYFGVWNINIESSTYVDLRSDFDLKPLKEVSLEKYSKDLIEELKSDRLSMIPFFIFSSGREKFLDTGNNSFMNLIIYLESARSNLDMLFNRRSPLHPKNRFKKELSYTRGFIIFKEQLFYICDKIFRKRGIQKLKGRLLDSSSLIQFNSILNQISESGNYADQCQYLKEAVQYTAFYSSLAETSVKAVIALRMFVLKKERRKEFIRYIFLRDVNRLADWRRYINEVQNEGFSFRKLSLSGLVKKAVCKNNVIYLPLHVIKGISQEVSDMIFDFVDNNNIESFQEFLEKSDRSFLKHHLVDLLINTGFFDIFNPNRSELSAITDRYFKNIKKEEEKDSLLFDPGEIEFGYNDTGKDISLSEKQKVEEELTGIIFTKNDIGDLLISDHLKIQDGSAFSDYPGTDHYNKNEYILYISVSSEDEPAIKAFAEMIGEDGNCSVEFLFPDSNQILKFPEKIVVNDKIIMKIKNILKDIPFYFEIK